MVVDQPLVSVGREICGDLAAGLRREWLVTNGLGGYASGTLAGIATRRYHGWLVAALAPPVDRTVLVAGAVEWATYEGRRYALSAHEYGDGTVDPHGYRHLQCFTLEGTLPVWRYALADALLERRLWMRHGANTTYVMYRLIAGSRPVHLEITPLVTYRDFHTLTFGGDWQPDVETAPDGLVVRARDGAVPFSIRTDGGRVIPSGGWYWNFRHREESARGLDDRSDLYAPGTLGGTVRPGGRLTLQLSTEDRSVGAGDRALDAERARQVLLLRRAAVERAEPVVQQLVLAADQFIVERRVGPPPAERAPQEGEATSEDAAAPPAQQETSAGGKTVIAGYPWFADWGRDTMIALPGLCLATGRADDARGLLRAFAPYLRDGLLPNNFPDRAKGDPGYNTIDAALWYVLAFHATHAVTGDATLANDLLPVVRAIVDAYAQGTRYGIGVDPADGLLRGGEPGVQLTWMDAKVG
ncbi:MAG: glycogen debranching enzyme N-terminal domain-containing protein, partial [bacterium]